VPVLPAGLPQNVLAASYGARQFCVLARIEELGLELLEVRRLDEASP
jgi:hypothetical protein